MKTVVITGSASGIGAALGAIYRERGDRVIGVDIKDAEIEADLSILQDRRDAILRTIDMAEGRIDRLALCAGLGSHIEDFARIASVNYFGAIHLLDGLKVSLAKGDHSAALVVCSNSARFGDFDEHPFVLACLAGDEAEARRLVAKENGFLAYAGSKHALCRALRRRVMHFSERRIRLNGIAPGPVQTPLLQGTIDHPDYGKQFEAIKIPLGRTAEADEMARYMAMMLSEDAAYLHGAIVYVDGGMDAALFPDRF